MTDFSLTAQKRSITGKKVSRLRREGFVPGIIYGAKIQPVNVQFPYRALEVTLMKAGGTNLIDMNIDGEKSYPVLARYVQRDIIRGNILHVDFFAVDMNVKIRTEVPINIVGENVLVNSKRAILITGTNTVTLEMLPSQLIQHIDVDISKLTNIGDTIFVANLPLEEGVSVINEPEEMIAKLVQPSAARAAEAAEEAETEDAGTLPEVISKGKEDEE